MNTQNILFLILIIGMGWSCRTKTNLDLPEEYTIVSGTVESGLGDKITLLRTENGKNREIADYFPDEQGHFGFVVKPEKECFYLVRMGRQELPLYLKGNQVFQLEISKKGFKQTAIPDRENEILYDWYESNDTLTSFDRISAINLTYDDFFPFYADFLPLMQKQHENVNSKNTRFNHFMHALIDLHQEYVAMKFIFTPRIKHPGKDDMAPFYKDFMTGNHFSGAHVLDLPNGFQTLGMHQMYKALYTSYLSCNRGDYACLATNIENDTLRAYYVLDYIKHYKGYDEFYEYIAPFQKEIESIPYVKERIDEYALGIDQFSPGAKGIPFSFENQKGEMVSFSNFKGKYVYIDVWATWCGPCKEEIPFLSKLEKRYHGKNIEFVSISMDKPKDKEKWKSFVKEHHLKGIQLISDNAFNNTMSKHYKINSIPRFLLFDPEGKIVDVNAKRPSDPELSKQLDQLLQ